MVNPSKVKGSKFEALIYRDIKTYLTDVKRVPGSGSFKGENADILCKAEHEYAVECKHYKSVTRNSLDKWWKKITKQAKEIDRKPLLVFRQNKMGISVRTIVQLNGYNIIADMSYLVWKSIMKKVIIGLKYMRS